MTADSNTTRTKENLHRMMLEEHPDYDLVSGNFREKIMAFLPANIPYEQMKFYLKDEARLKRLLKEVFNSHEVFRKEEKNYYKLFYKEHFNLNLGDDFAFDIPMGYNSRIHSNIFLPRDLGLEKIIKVLDNKVGINSGNNFNIESLISHDDRSNVGKSYCAFFHKSLESEELLGYGAGAAQKRKLKGITFKEMLLLWLRRYVDGNEAKTNSSTKTLCTGTRLVCDLTVSVAWSYARRTLELATVPINTDLKNLKNSGTRIMHACIEH